MIPDRPGWWWRKRHDTTAPEALLVYEAADGRLMVRPYSGLRSPLPGERAGEVLGWLGPVAPPGSVAPEEHARAVRLAFIAGAEVGTARRPSRESWGGSRDRRDLIARVGLAAVEAVERA